MIMAQYELTEEHKAVGLSLGEDDDSLYLYLNGLIVKRWYWQYASLRDLKREADRYLEPCPEAIHYEPYDRCKLTDKVCFRNTGNQIFDRPCDYYTDFLNKVNERV